MSTYAHRSEEAMEEIEQRALFSTDPENRISQSEAFEILEAAGVEEIKWDSSLNSAYSQWIYLNIK